MFTFGDIRNIAIQIEENGAETYRNAAKTATNPQIARTLEWMADEEKNHAKWFSNLQSDKPLSPQQQEIEAMGRTLLQDMLKGHPFLLDISELNKVKDLHELLTRSKTFEQDTVVFYQFLLGFVDDAETRRQLENIIDEERSHATQLEKMAKLQEGELINTTPCKKKTPC